ncbi:hypothetical protein ACTJKO_14885 [Curtobacterium sp. 22159]|uniref:hypothetical protein n=1 Tax=Curtobacterium sp. 22159 TaxID=3453882 RepID=UPI003F8515D5
MTDASVELTERVQGFAQELMDTLTAVVGFPVGFEVKVGTSRSRPQVSISQSEPLGVPLTVDGDVLFRLLVQFRCRWNTAGNYLAVEQSAFTVRIEKISEPFFHYDYVRDAHGSVPVSHLNIHAHRDEVVWAMLMARTNRGKRRSKDAAKGKITRISTLHFPLGGHRHRPSLEDVLEMLVHEFGIDHADTAENAIAEGRRRFRSIQTAVGAHDDPEAAAAALRELGYVVSAPEQGPIRRTDRLGRY